MAKFVERLWNPTETSALSRADKKPGHYFAFVPDELDIELPRLPTEVEQSATEALTSLIRADERIGEKGSYLNHLLIRSESISSSWIEGNRITPKKLAIAETLSQGSKTAIDVIANIRATETAINDLSNSEVSLTTHDIENLQHIIEPRLQFGIRKEQNWVGGQGWSPLRAEFVPPPEFEVPRLLHNLSQFASSTQGNPVVRAAIAHAQFETIHPFIDGNGRTGRALIHTIFKRTGAIKNTLIPVSKFFAKYPKTYIDGLNSYRSTPPDIGNWINIFSESVRQSAESALVLATSINLLDERIFAELLDFREKKGLNPVRPRKDAVTIKIIGALAKSPVLTAAAVSEAFGVSIAAAHKALYELAEAGILSKTNNQKGKTICWTSNSHLELIEN